jgi:hypothetical protein
LVRGLLESVLWLILHHLLTPISAVSKLHCYMDKVHTRLVSIQIVTFMERFVKRNMQITISQRYSIIIGVTFLSDTKSDH